jgi:hypothetical protein
MMNGFILSALAAPLFLIVITTTTTSAANANANSSILIEDFSGGPINKWTTMNGKVKYTFVHLFLPLLLVSAECFVCFICMYTIDISFSYFFLSFFFFFSSIHSLLFFWESNCILFRTNKHKSNYIKSNSAYHIISL